MAEFHLLCNVTKCRKELKHQAWVTCCSHIFCIEHGQYAADKEKCTACEHTFSDRYDIVAMDLNPTEQHKSMVLAGLSPERIMEIANRSLSFWYYQTYQERLYKDTTIKNAKQNALALKDYCETLSAKHNVEVQKLGRDCQNLKKDLDEKNKQIDELVSQLAEKSRIVQNLQTKYDTLKRKCATNILSSDQEPASPGYKSNMDFDIRSHSDGYSCDNRSRYNGSNGNHNRDFVFGPKIPQNHKFNIF